ncbi:MAG TPA: coproporphyrinogen dehydrogenase HemZ, partial [Clostridium sp.]|nr:coproporphyrinogen dehydrogenase HemZ [Clostridium sp.]
YTSLSELQLERLLRKVAELFHTDDMEYTVEAGRPDTITKEKLRLMKEYGVNRISINPQTMNEETLKRIGRKHSVEDIRRVFQEARELGHENINMDLILGLPGE